MSRTLFALRKWLVGVGLFSGVVNLLGLTGSFFMLQVYDRVLASRSVPTLVALSVLAAALYGLQGFIDILRARLLVRVGAYLDERLATRLYETMLRLPLHTARGRDNLQPLRDLDTLRNFLSGQGPVAILDLPWIPVYLGFVFALHPWLGYLAGGGALVLIALTFATELLSRAPVAVATDTAAQRISLVLAGQSNAEVLQVMGFAGRLTSRWRAANEGHRAALQHTSDIAGGMSSASKTFRALLQSALLALGALLTIWGEVSAGAIIASSIVASRALAPIETAIANWRSFLAARTSRRQLAEVLDALPPLPQPLRLPPPRHELVIEGLFTGPPGSAQHTVQNVSMRVAAGQALGLIGPSAAGKSSLARGIIGAWPARRGTVRLDGAALEQWHPADLGRHIGYLPQDIELFEGSITDNITRLAEDPDPVAVIAAARAADIHEMILRMPNGYETAIGDRGSALSAGQRQRIGLARALYGDPFLVVLDEPNSNLDADGEAALIRAIAGIRRRGGIVIVVAHRPSALAGVDLLAVVMNGTLQAFGSRQAILQKLAGKAGDPKGIAAAEARHGA